MAISDTRITLSAEKQFMHRDAYNRGFVQIPRMIVACIGLSPQAKSVYNFIANYVFEHGKSAFPSVHRIAIACNMTPKSVVKYIAELIEKDLIKKVRRGGGRTNDYYLKDVHEVRLLRVSEMMWSALEGAVEKSRRSWEQAYSALETIVKQMRSQGLSLTELDAADEVREALEADLLEVMQGGEPKLVYIPRVNKTKTAGVDSLAAQDSQGNSYKDRHESEWKTDHFRFYFYDKYRELTGESHADTKTVHRTIISRMLNKLDNDKTMMKKYIDAFFEIGYENKSMENFGSSGRFNEISLYIKEGKKPYYLEKAEKKRKKESTEQTYLGMADDDFLKLLGGGTNGRS